MKTQRKKRSGKYSAVHKWLADNFGKATHCEGENCTKKSKSFQWALKRGCKYDYFIENFVPLCASCHRLYDQKQEWIDKMAKKLRGRKHTEKHKKAIAKGCVGVNKNNKNASVKVDQRDLNGNLIKIWESITEAAVSLKINKSGITMACRGQLKKSGNYIWNYRSKSQV